MLPLLVLPFLAACAAQPAAHPPTIAESSGYTATARYDEVNAFAKALADASPRVRLSTMGKSGEGRDLPLIIVADPPVATAEDAAKSGKLVVLLLGGIHSGECDGKEALLALARQIAADVPGEKPDDKPTASPLLKDLILAFVPDYNPDGNERREAGKNSRPGQIGPEQGQGIRENAASLDLNRDYVKLEAPETRAQLKFIRDWDPAIIVDTHTTNGSKHRYLLTYDGPRHPAGPASIREYLRTDLLPAAGKLVKDRTGYDTFFYGNFEGAHARWEAYPDQPRYGGHYVGLRNRLSILTESYSYAPYKDRVLAQVQFVRACLERAAADKDKIAKLIREADAAAADAGKDPKDDDKVPLRTKLAAAEGKVTVLGFDEQPGAQPGQTRDYDVDHVCKSEVELAVARPFAYLLAPDAPNLSTIVEVLQRHGIKVEELREDIDLDVETYRIDTVAKAVRPFQNHSLLTLETTSEAASRRYPAGSIIVRTAQPLGSLAVYLLEPQSADGLAAWNFFDASLTGDSPTFPVARLAKPTPLVTTAIRPFAEDRTLDKPVTFEAIFESKDPPNFNGAAIGGMTWLDDGINYLANRDGKLRVIDAATGRSKLFFADPAPMSEALAKIPTVGEKTAKDWANGGSFNFTKDRTAALFNHENDLYYAKLDGSAAARLTSSPESEDYAQFSPDGRFVAFVRANDLWVVDVATQTERALTSGGSDTLRNGKADWVYFEELYGRNWRLFWWSPDSARLAFIRTDNSPVPVFTIAGDIPADQNVEQVRYPKPGQPNPRVELYTVSVGGGTPQKCDLGDYDAESSLIAGVGWWPDSSAMYAHIAGRTQTWVDIVRVAPGGGRGTRLFRESTKAWVDLPMPAPTFLKDGSFLFLSERSGYRHIYRYSAKGELMAQLTDGPWEVRSIARAREDLGQVYFTATRDNDVGQGLYRIPLDQKAEDAGAGAGIERLTPVDGTHNANVAPAGPDCLYIDSFSTASTPTRVELRAATDNRLVRLLDTNPVYDLEEYRRSPYELVEIPGSDGFAIEAGIIKPVGFDAAKKYPVWFSTYAGPASPVVRDSWDGATFNQALANLGFVVFEADPRSASGKGAVWAWAAYKQLGVSEMADIKTAIEWLKGHAWVDGSRIGMSGHSYGGFMTAYALTHSDLFAAGIAGAPVTDWRDYDSIYTERFMLTPQENPEGYEKTSVVKAAAKVHGRLLLLHGMMDDNVHAQNSTRLIRALQQADKPFEMMYYPENRHGIGGKAYNRLQYEFITRLLKQDADTPVPSLGGP